MGPGRLVLVQKMQKILVDLLGAEPVGRLAEVLGEFRQMEHVALDGPGRTIAQLQVFDEPLTQGGHDSLHSKQVMRQVQLRKLWHTKRAGANRPNRAKRTSARRGGFAAAQRAGVHHLSDRY